jgi:hypothetical protein
MKSSQLSGGPSCFKMAYNWMKGKRVQIAGSATDQSDPTKLNYAHLLVKKLTLDLLGYGGGFVVTVGEEPTVKNGELAKTFDWTILETIDNCAKENAKWPDAQGAPIIAIGFENWEERVPTNRKLLWNKLISEGRVELQIIPSEMTFGGVMRQMQSKFGDLLLTIGGSIGVYHLAQLYQASKKPVIPLNLSFQSGVNSASEMLSKHAIRDCQDFFEFQPTRDAITAYSRLSLKYEMLDPTEFVIRLFSFIGHLPQPTVFNIRLLSPHLPEYDKVESYFRNVVDQVTGSIGYKRFEMETDPSVEPFMNVELFQKLHFSSLVIADLSGVRPNCCVELGYALGLSKKIIITAIEGTKLPWDTESIHCHFWSPFKADTERRSDLKLYMEKNINREPLIRL